MEDVLEFIIGYIGSVIYGTENRPRHPIWRNSVRIIAFGGAFVAAASMFGLLGNILIPLALVLFWFFFFMIVLTTEYYFGSLKVTYAILTAFFALVLIFVSTQF